jgi:flagellar assembly protein FliH
VAVIRNKQIARNQPLLFSVRDAEEEAKRTVDAARVQAETVTAAARVDGFEEGRQGGYQTGLTQGYAAGVEQALAEHKQQLTAAAEALSQAAARFDEARAQFTREALADCVELALAVARRVTKRQAQLDPQVLAANLEQALKMVIGCTRLRIAFHPLDRATITQVLEKLRFSNVAVETAQVVEDPAIARGGCRIDTEHGTVDADIDAQLQRLIDQLMPMSKSTEAGK